MVADAKQQLVDFLIRRAFDPVLRAKSDGRSDSERRKLEHVQKATESEIERFRAYQSAQEVVTNFKRDLNSRAARKVHAELRALHLPTIEDIHEEFDAKARDLGVHASA